MKVCSWDIGIVHLAYCVLEYEPDRNDGIIFPIHHWENIDLTEQKDIFCSGKKKNGDDCPHKAFYKRGDIGYCKSHKVGLEEGIDFPVFYPCTKRTKDVCVKCQKKAKFYNQENYCTVHKDQQLRQWISGQLEKVSDPGKCDCGKKEFAEGLCRTHLQQKKLKEIKSQDIEFNSRTNSNKIHVEQLELSLIRILDQKPELLQVDEVLIENQPAYSNPKMKNIASTLKTFFHIRGIIDRERTGSTIKRVRMNSPEGKLKVNADQTFDVLENGDDGKKYKLTKALGVKYCRQLIRNDSQSLAIFESLKKKDDLCDAMLQGAYYLTKNKSLLIENESPSSIELEDGTTEEPVTEPVHPDNIIVV